MRKDLKYYCYQLEKLRRDYKNGGAPHKPILLISLIQAFQQKLFLNEKVTIIPELVGLFKSNWQTLVSTKHNCLFSLPFYHMISEPFWRLVPNEGCEIWVKSKSSMRSINNLTTAIKYAIIDKELVDLMMDFDNSNLLINFILETYFPNTKANFFSNNNSYFKDIELQIIEEKEDDYKKRLLKIRDELNSEMYQEEIYIRSNVFKRKIPKIYNYTCCISGLRIDSLFEVSMIDACHIIPFSESYNDTITNGIALCPNLHRAFDRGLISIDNDYRVLISDRFNEYNDSTYSIKQFNGKQIHLPYMGRYYPSQEALLIHRKRFNF